MATSGKTVKTRTRAEKIVRKQKASFKQRVSWRKFRINGAVGFSEGNLRGLVDRLRALISELPVGHSLRYEIADELVQLEKLHSRIQDFRLQALELAELAESWNMQLENSQ